MNWQGQDQGQGGLREQIMKPGSNTAGRMQDCRDIQSRELGDLLNIRNEKETGAESDAKNALNC